MVAIPQSMAYAIIAGIDPIYGLYTAIIPAIIGGLFGSSKQLVTGPTNANALVVASALLAFSSHVDYIEYVFALAILSGFLQLLLGVLRLGNLIRYVSNSVLTGFLVGASVLITINQIGNFLGIEHPIGESTGTVLWSLIQGLPASNIFVLATSTFSLFLIIIGTRLQRRLPIPLLTIILSSLLVQLTGWHQEGVKLISDLGFISATKLTFHLPNISSDDVSILLPGAGAIALISIVQTISVAKVIGLSTGQRIDPSRELMGQGLASISGGLFQSFPPAGSPTRSAVNLMLGAKTRLASIISGVIVLLALLAFTRFIGFIPIASLAAIIIFSAFKMVNLHHVQQTLRSRNVSRLVFFTTFIAMLVLPLHMAIYLGTALSIGIFLYESSELRINYLVLNESGEFVEHNLDDLPRDRLRFAVVNIEGEFHFPAVDHLEANLDKIIGEGIHVLILRIRGMRHLASTGVTALQNLIERAQANGTEVFICGVTEKVEQILTATGITSLVGEDREFKASDVLFKSTRQALERANEIMTDKDHSSELADEKRPNDQDTHSEHH